MEENLKVTCLHDSHVALGAKMSPFAGFDMPIQYAGITQEHLAVRQNVGMFDVSHMGEIFVSGPDAEAFVNHIFTNQVAGMEPGKILYGMMCYPDGGVVDDLLVYREAAENHYLLVVNAANIDKDYAWMLEQKAGFDVKVDNQSDAWGQIAVQGPKAEETLVKLGFPKAADLTFYTYYREGDLIVSRTGYTGEDGFEVYSGIAETKALWQKLLDAGVEPCGLGCRDTLRFEAGLPTKTSSAATPWLPRRRRERSRNWWVSKSKTRPSRVPVIPWNWKTVRKWAWSPPVIILSRWTRASALPW